MLERYTFYIKNAAFLRLTTHTRVERATFCLGGKCSIQLS